MSNLIKTSSSFDIVTPQEAKEIIKCANDPKYFFENYIKVQHPIEGSILFKLFDYQIPMIDSIITHNKACVVAPRQVGKTCVMVAYILWFAMFNPDKIIGIAANKLSNAKEILSRISFAYQELPRFIKPVVYSFNKFDISFDNGSKIMASSTTENTFRGFSLSCVSSKNTLVTVRDKETGEISQKYISELVEIDK